MSGSEEGSELDRTSLLVAAVMRKTTGMEVRIQHTGIPIPAEADTRGLPKHAAVMKSSSAEKPNPVFPGKVIYQLYISLYQQQPQQCLPSPSSHLLLDSDPTTLSTPYRSDGSFRMSNLIERHYQRTMLTCSMAPLFWATAAANKASPGAYDNAVGPYNGCWELY
jgi:hypothetical protein